ncbi:glutamate--tRNA ligase [Buchnera aphidicola]|uniref:glutamate--tRNA ligase n=1 Tax=Buchnera aphidicola TaxID=9 RepID=UPI003464E139
MFVKTRFAPSSTGVLHIGSMRTALYSWLFAKHHQGNFVLRIEDTDIKRSNKIFINNILKTLQWLGIVWDEGPYLQSDRICIYKEKIIEMLDLGFAYKCYCSTNRLTKIRTSQILKGEKPCYDRKCRNKKYNYNNKEYVIRFKNPLNGEVSFQDSIRGRILFNNTELDDLIIQRRNGMPTYNFCVVIDDIDMKITHIIRGEDHINNTPRQINIIQALNAKVPVYAHVSMIIDSKKQNLSKRKNALSVLEYKEYGFLKESILNFLIKLGWSYGNREIFSLEEMKKLFSIHKISKSSSECNFEKLIWFNHYYLNTLPINDYLIQNFQYQLKKLKINFSSGPSLFKIIKFLRHRCNNFQEMAMQSRYFFEEYTNISGTLIKKYYFNDYHTIIKILYEKLCNICNWNAKEIMKILKKISENFHTALKNICMLLRIFITGSDVSPSISTIMEILGKFNSLKRIKKYCMIIHQK